MISGTKKELQSIFRRKHFAYNQVFDKQNQYTKDVLKDLAKFCRANESTFNVDPRKQSNLDGRREVWLRIQKYLNLDLKEIYKLNNIED